MQLHSRLWHEHKLQRETRASLVFRSAHPLEHGVVRCCVVWCGEGVVWCGVEVRIPAGAGHAAPCGVVLRRHHVGSEGCDVAGRGREGKEDGGKGVCVWAGGDGDGQWVGEQRPTCVHRAPTTSIPVATLSENDF